MRRHLGSETLASSRRQWGAQDTWRIDNTLSVMLCHLLRLHCVCRWREVERGWDGGIWKARLVPAIYLLMSLVLFGQATEHWQPLGLPFSFFPLHSPFNPLMVHWVPAILHNSHNCDISFQTVNLHSRLSLKSTSGAILDEAIGRIFFLPPSFPQSLPSSLPPSFALSLSPFFPTFLSFPL